jgi:hypothetical protein
MKKRGKILRDTNAGQGMLMAGGLQYSFSLEGTWKSEEAPRVGMVVDIDFNSNDEIVAITAIPESQLAREQAEVAMAAARERGAAIASGAVAKFGIPSLVAAACIVVGWFMLPAVSVNIPFGGSGHLTFWAILGVVNSGNMASLARAGSSSSGIYGLLAVIALCGPFVHHFWRDKRALLGGLLPLLFMLLVGLVIRNAMAEAFGAASNGVLGEFARTAQKEAMKAISIGSGVYLAMLASLYFAAVGTRKFLAAKAGEAQS